MTLHLIDIASYQAGMDLGAAQRAGFSLVNIKTTQGVTYVHKAGPAWADKARKLGMGICTFHWLNNAASGKAQADFAYAQIRAMGGPVGMAHQVDCEDTARPATLTILRDYIQRMQALLGRHVVVYTGDWWWRAGWRVDDLTPYVWAAPNHGYNTAYPGDTSPDWHAGYGGWADYALLQYAVGPIAGAGGGDISKTAIRDPQVWAALTGTNTVTPQGDPVSEQTDQIIAAWSKGMPKTPAGDAVAPVDWRIRDEAWQASVNKQLAALAAQQPATGGGTTAPIDYDQLATLVASKLDALIAERMQS